VITSGDTAGRPVVDAHAHFFGADLDASALVPDSRWPVLAVDTSERGRLMLGGSLFRQVSSSLWDVDRRLADLDAAGVSHQVISPVPVTMATWADAGAAVGYALATNDSLARAVRASGGRLYGLGTLPLPHVSESVRELERVVGLGLRGVQVGTQVAGMDWDDVRLAPVLEAAHALDAAVFIHPIGGGSGVVRRGGQPYDFGLGMTTDTAIAATALTLGGVLERLPRLRLGLAHGCGTFPWTYPRLRLGAEIWCHVDAARLDSAVRRLWVDSLVLDPEHLRLLVRLFGPDRVMVGTDHPFVAGQLDGAIGFVGAARRLGALDAEQATRILAANTLSFLGLTDEASRQRPERAGVPA